MNSLQLFDNFFKETFNSFKDKDLWKGVINNTFLNSNQYSIYQKEGKYFIEIAVPGLSNDDISVSVDKERRLLKVEGQMVEESEEKKESKVIWYHKGEMNQNFSLYLPDDLELDSVQADCLDGKLNISFKVKDENEVLGENIINVPVLENKSKTEVAENKPKSPMVGNKA